MGHALQERVAAQDWSWNLPAEDYIDLYYRPPLSRARAGCWPSPARCVPHSSRDHRELKIGQLLWFLFPFFQFEFIFRPPHDFVVFTICRSFLLHGDVDPTNSSTSP